MPKKLKTEKGCIIEVLPIWEDAAMADMSLSLEDGIPVNTPTLVKRVDLRLTAPEMRELAEMLTTHADYIERKGKFEQAGHPTGLYSGVMEN